MARILFLAIASLGLLAALGTVLSRNLVHAALYLVGFFFCVACLFVMLEAEFLAAVQVLIYIGAVAILLMFGIMLTRNTRGDDESSLSGSWRLPGLVAGLCVFAALVFGINNAVSPSGAGAWVETASRPALVEREGEPAWSAERRRAVDDMARVVGVEFMTRYVMAFEVAGLLLTAALVGAVALASRDERPAANRDEDEDRPVEAEGPLETVSP
ncbi:NADH-quinone oxidoreductase subunit J [Planctomyces sp. SH-PL62]|uniref:NADH-quinone oxidoreductase subunit J family protein n=1 Tax=Planctomyces sp. SH-PL62 TaxID=1636152 RepID=UPI00078E3DEE|nr:NADH-quinone oxidoreductase subunit J [Planctomyces sp. SH-PL62]AMV38907.1 NADH-quinone oxidoreductase subunit J [Planctomyces sp. SH-PL62]